MNTVYYVVLWEDNEVYRVEVWFILIAEIFVKIDIILPTGNCENSGHYLIDPPWAARVVTGYYTCRLYRINDVYTLYKKTFLLKVRSEF